MKAKNALLLLSVALVALWVPAIQGAGRLHFRVPAGIKYGQHWLNVKFEENLVPFRILTSDEEKFLSKNYGEISKQVEDAFKKKS